MTDVRQQLTEALDAAEAAARAATEGPWWVEQDDDVWKLHGVAFRIPAGEFTPEQVVGKQIAKAPKRDIRYAEYWPDAADEAHILRWDPATVLRLVERDRKLIAEYALYEHVRYPDSNGGYANALEDQIDAAAEFWLGTPEVDR